MKISGFTYVRNGFDYGVPFLESIQSILPICNEMIIAVGDSVDGTREAIQGLQSEKIKIIDTIWDMNLRKGGKIFANQTNFALDAVSGDWAFHIQADEVIHEKDLTKIMKAIEEDDPNKKVEGFILPFLHFWGGYNYIRNSRRVHKHEVRIFRNGLHVRSYRDSQGFRKYKSIADYESGKYKGEKLQVKKIDAPVYHYNGIRPPEIFRKKAEQMGAFYKTTDEVQKILDEKNYNWDNVDRVVEFKGSHPLLMMPKVKAQNWEYTFDPKKAVWKNKDRLLQPVEDLLGFKIGEYKNYKLMK
jgi:hypothetical protein